MKKSRWRQHVLRITEHDTVVEIAAKAMGVVAFCALLGWWLRALITAAGSP